MLAQRARVFLHPHGLRSLAIRTADEVTADRSKDSAEDRDYAYF